MAKQTDQTKECPIVAVSTPPGRGAIAIVRLSGSGSAEVAGKMFTPFPSRPNELKHGVLCAGNVRDSAMCVYFAAPHSCTGEEAAEFHTHGGVFTAQAVVRACIKNGCRLAQNGEFTKRAFLNGKLSLAAAEGVIDVIDAESGRAVNCGHNLLTGKLDEKILAMQDELTEIIASVTAVLDYPEEDLELPAMAKIKKQAGKILADAEKLLCTAEEGKLIKNGVDVVIAGAPNTGKSSLFNSLVGFDRAIVAESAGTTRDTLAQSVLYKDIKFNFTDTAGMRETGDYVEKEGVLRAQAAVASADIVLEVYDASQKIPHKKETDGRVICVFNKIDLVPSFTKPQEGVAVSALTGKNINALKEAIFKKTKLDKIVAGDALLTNSRHADCLKHAADALKRAIAAAEKTTPDCVAAELTEAWQAVGEITGVTANEEIITRVFSKFCLGK